MKVKLISIFLLLAASSPVCGGADASGGVLAAAASLLQVQPHKTPEDAAVNVLKYMRGEVAYRPDFPEQRGPHEWDGRRALAAGSVNGCVESAKVFFELFRAAYPEFKAVYLDSFNVAGGGGHAAVELTGSNGRAFIVDAMSFPKLPGRVELDEESLSRPLDFRKDYIGKVIQFPGRGDVLLEKKNGKYRMAVYPYRQVFDTAALSENGFDTLDGLNKALTAYAATPVNFTYLQDNGLILPYTDPEKTGFIYLAEGGLAKYVIYGCHTSLPARDDAEAIEPAARKAYAETGKSGTCDWAGTK